MVFRILVINPGSTSTKVAVFDGDKALLSENIEHDAIKLEECGALTRQVPYRKELITNELKSRGFELESFDAVVGRGGMLAPIEGGTYEVNDSMIETLQQARYGEHASNLGPILARDFAQTAACPAYIVDAVSTDELADVARLSGMPEIPRVSLFHALNHKAVARQVASDMGRAYADVRFIVAHLGTGISVGAHIGGRIVDVFDPMNEGAFSLDRAGSLPVRLLINMCYSGKYTYREMLKKINGDGGMAGYLGTKDLRRAWDMAREGDRKALLVLETLAYQIAKDIGAMATVCEGRVDRIIFTGGMSHSPSLMELLRPKVEFIAPITIVPGEEEMKALAAGALRILNGEEAALGYS